MQVPHASPDGDLGTSANTLILLEIRSAGHLEVHAKQVRLEFGAARDSGLHVLPAADVGPQNGPSNRRLCQGPNYAKAAIAAASDSAELIKLLRRPRLTEKRTDVVREKVGSLAMSGMRSECAGIEMQVVGGVVPVDVGVFQNVGFHAQYAEMTNGALNYLGMSITENFGELRPSGSGVECFDGVRDAHVWRRNSERVQFERSY